MIQWDNININEIQTWKYVDPITFQPCWIRIDIEPDKVFLWNCDFDGKKEPYETIVDINRFRRNDEYSEEHLLETIILTNIVFKALIEKGHQPIQLDYFDPDIKSRMFAEVDDLIKYNMLKICDIQKIRGVDTDGLEKIMYKVRGKS